MYCYNVWSLLKHIGVALWVADPPPPLSQGVTQPPYQPAVPPATFGFVDNAERLNSRAAMVCWCVQHATGLTVVLCIKHTCAHVCTNRCPPTYAHPVLLPLQIGFFALLAVEAIANKGLLEMLGFTVGQGLGFEL